MPETGSLRRLGGGRWETRDGRFRIEPQSGTWTVVDAERTDELGLPLVRGPFRSLAAAREAIEDAREEGVTVSPLAEKIEAAKKARPASRRSKEGSSPARRPAAKEKPQEPAWLGKLEESQRRRARSLVRRLEEAGVPRVQALDTAREELVDDRPAVARLAVERRLSELLGSAKDAGAITRAVADLLVSGEDETLAVGWRLTDREGRPIRRLSLPPRK